MTGRSRAADKNIWQHAVEALAASSWGPGWIWLAVTLAWPLLVFGVHAVSAAMIGPAELPFGGVRFAWTVVATGSLLGLLTASHEALERGAAADLRDLRPILPAAVGRPADLKRDIVDPSAAVRWGAVGLGLASGVALVSFDPSLRGLHADLASTDPRYVLFVMHNMLIGGLGMRLFATEVHMTRAYARLGERVNIDLVDQSAHLVFGRKGLRTVAIGVLLSSGLSMFWLLDSAGQVNVVLPFVMLGLAASALVSPMLGVRRNIKRVKAVELGVVAEAIRFERDRLLGHEADAAPRQAGRLSELIQYDAFIRSVREWPFDLSIASRSLLFLLLGAGSWLGGAMVERLLGVWLD